MAFSPVLLNLQILVPNRFEIDSPRVLSTMDASVTSAWQTEKPDKKKVSTSIYFWFLISDGFNSFGEEGTRTGIHGNEDRVTSWYSRKWSLAETGEELQQLPQVTSSTRQAIPPKGSQSPNIVTLWELAFKARAWGGDSLGTVFSTCFLTNPFPVKWLEGFFSVAN